MVPQDTTFRRDWLHDFTEDNAESITVGDGKTCKVAGHGTIHIRRKIGNQWLNGSIENVLYVPSLSRNLFSVGACTKIGYDVIFTDDLVTISKDGVPMAYAVSHGINLYRVLIQSVSRTETNTAVESSIRLWHERLGHANIKILQEMNKEGLINIGRFSPKDKFFCEACQLGKQHRHPFNDSQPRNTKPSELIYSDVDGPMQNESIGGSRFYVIFKDDASGYTHIYFLKHKADVFEKFKEYFALVTNKFNMSLKILRVDNGKEYVNQNMKELRKTRGIQLELTAPYTPEQNGCSERQNRTLVEKARTMLHAKNLPLNLWAEAMNTAVYVYNRTPLSHKNGQIPFETWTGKRVHFRHIKTFGCNAYMHIPKQQRRKWDVKSKRMIFVGYEADRPTIVSSIKNLTKLLFLET